MQEMRRDADISDRSHSEKSIELVDSSYPMAPTNPSMVISSCGVKSQGSSSDEKQLSMSTSPLNPSDDLFSVTTVSVHILDELFSLATTSAETMNTSTMQFATSSAKSSSSNSSISESLQSSGAQAGDEKSDTSCSISKLIPTDHSQSTVGYEEGSHSSESSASSPVCGIQHLMNGYIEDTCREYQPEGHANISTSVSPVNLDDSNKENIPSGNNVALPVTCRSPADSTTEDELKEVTQPFGKINERSEDFSNQSPSSSSQSGLHILLNVNAYDHFEQGVQMSLSPHKQVKRPPLKDLPTQRNQPAAVRGCCANGDAMREVWKRQLGESDSEDRSQKHQRTVYRTSEPSKVNKSPGKENRSCSNEKARPRSPVYGWRRHSMSEEAKARVRNISSKVFPNLYKELKQEVSPKKRS